MISRVVEYLPSRIKRLIFLDAFVLEDGQSVYDNLPSFLIELLARLVQASSDNTTLLPWEVWRDHFIQNASEEVARALWEQLSPEPNQPNVEKLDLKTFYSLNIPKSFIYCRQDMTLPPGSFHPQMSSRLGTFKLVEMDGSHEVLFTHPAELADRACEHLMLTSVISRMIIKMISPAILFLPSLEAYFPHEGKGRMWRKTIASKISFFVICFTREGKEKRDETSRARPWVDI